LQSHTQCTLLPYTTLFRSLIDVNAEDIYFTAGATEAINIALQGIPARGGKPKHIITAQTEHPAVLDTCRYLETIGVEATYLPVSDRKSTRLNSSHVKISYA